MMVPHYHSICVVRTCGMMMVMIGIPHFAYPEMPTVEGTNKKKLQDASGVALKAFVDEQESALKSINRYGGDDGDGDGDD